MFDRLDGLSELDREMLLAERFEKREKLEELKNILRKRKRGSEAKTIVRSVTPNILFHLEYSRLPFTSVCGGWKMTDAQLRMRNLRSVVLWKI